MKIGQILSYMGGVPDDVRGMYQQALGTLRTYADPMAPEACLGAIARELGGSVVDVVDWLDPETTTVASIGQVYRTRLDNRAVVVNVQCSEIAEATVSDLQNLDGSMAMMRTLMSRMFA